jgi:hypothetical protein
LSVVGILHLGNITFNPSRDTEGGSQIASGTECNKVQCVLNLLYTSAVAVAVA